MASSTLTKTPCATCGNKSTGIFKCEGCSQIFCRKHVNEHRDMLNHQLDAVIIEYDVLQQTLMEQKNDHYACFKQIDKWEKGSITKIQQTAHDARQQVEQLLNSQKEVLTKKLQSLAKELEKARSDDAYVETDLRTWATALGKLKCEVNSGFSSITVHEDSTKIFVKKLSVSPIEQPEFNVHEKFGNPVGNIRIEKEALVASYTGEKESDAFARGIKEYSSGKYKIRFIGTKTRTQYCMGFGIVSKNVLSLQNEADMQRLCYGWYTNDAIVSSGKYFAREKGFSDLSGKSTFQIELLLDCGNRKTRYLNEETRKMHEMDVNITECPFPWQIFFYLYDVGDSVRLLSSTEVI